MEYACRRAHFACSLARKARKGAEELPPGCSAEPFARGRNGTYMLHFTAFSARHYGDRSVAQKIIACFRIYLGYTSQVGAMYLCMYADQTTDVTRAPPSAHQNAN